MAKCATKILLIFHLLANFLAFSNGLLKSKDEILVPAPEPDQDPHAHDPHAHDPHAHNKKDQPPQVHYEKDHVYLIQAPRSEFTISQAPINIKVEAWLRLNKINYTSISSMVFLGSSADGSVPFAEMNGKKLSAPDSTQNGMESEGSNAIIQRVAEHFNLSWPKGTIGKTEEERLRRQIDYDLFNTVVMYTRSSTYYQKDHNGEWEKIPNVNFKASTPTMSLNLTTLKLEYSENGVMMPVKTGLDFMIKDESIRELMFSLLVDLPAVTDAQKTLLGVVLTRKLVNQYYDAKHDKTEEAKKAFLKKGGWTTKNDGSPISWAEVDTRMQKMCTIFLINRLILAEKGAMDNAKQYLVKNNFATRQLSAYKDHEIVDRVNKIFTQISKRLNDTKDGKKRFYLFGTERTPADCSLFGLLTVFFGIPLTVPAMEKYMEAVKASSHPHHILVTFFDEMKKELGMNEHAWKKMTTRPWPLNFDDDKKIAFEKQMENKVWDAAKRAMNPNNKPETSLLEIGNEH